MPIKTTTSRFISWSIYQMDEDLIKLIITDSGQFTIWHHELFTHDTNGDGGIVGK